MEKKYVNAEEAKKFANECELLGINDKFEPEIVEEFKNVTVTTAKKNGHDIEETVNKILELVDTIGKEEYVAMIAAIILTRTSFGTQLNMMIHHHKAIMLAAGKNFMKKVGDNPEEAEKILTTMV